MKKYGLIAMAAAMMLTFGGCGSDNAANNLGNAKDGTLNDNGYQYDTYGNKVYTSGGAAYWDGYGINSGRAVTGDGTMSQDVQRMGTDMKNAGRDVANGVERALDGNTASMAN